MSVINPGNASLQPIRETAPLKPPAPPLKQDRSQATPTQTSDQTPQAEDQSNVNLHKEMIFSKEVSFPSSSEASSEINSLLSAGETQPPEVSEQDQLTQKYEQYRDSLVALDNAHSVGDASQESKDQTKAMIKQLDSNLRILKRNAKTPDAQIDVFKRNLDSWKKDAVAIVGYSAAEDQKKYAQKEKTLEKIQTGAEVINTTATIAVEGLAEVTGPAGKLIKVPVDMANAYKDAKAKGKSDSEAWIAVGGAAAKSGIDAAGGAAIDSLNTLAKAKEISERAQKTGKILIEVGKAAAEITTDTAVNVAQDSIAGREVSEESVMDHLVGNTIDKGIDKTIDVVASAASRGVNLPENVAEMTHGEKAGKVALDTSAAIKKEVFKTEVEKARGKDK